MIFFSLNNDQTPHKKKQDFGSIANSKKNQQKRKSKENYTDFFKNINSDVIGLMLSAEVKIQIARFSIG